MKRAIICASVVSMSVATAGQPNAAQPGEGVPAKRVRGVGAPGVSNVHLKYLGTAGWEISDGRTTILIDPYLSRLHMTAPNDDVLPGDPRPRFTAADAAQSDTATIDAHIARADFILMTHTHTDHALDVPYIARKTGAT